MLRRSFIVALLLTAGGASAATVSIAVADPQGRPVPDAIVTLVPASGKPVASHVPEKGIVAQSGEMFAPLLAVFSVSLLPQRGMKHMHMDN